MKPKVSLPLNSSAAPVVPSGPADQAGLQPGDVLLEVNGRPILDARMTMSDIASIPPGERLPLTVMRSGEALEVVLEVGERPAPAALRPIE